MFEFARRKKGDQVQKMNRINAFKAKAKKSFMAS